jgi:hypothetical protein
MIKLNPPDVDAALKEVKPEQMLYGRSLIEDLLPIQRQANETFALLQEHLARQVSEEDGLSILRAQSHALLHPKQPPPLPPKLCRR